MIDRRDPCAVFVGVNIAVMKMAKPWTLALLGPYCDPNDLPTRCWGEIIRRDNRKRAVRSWHDQLPFPDEFKGFDLAVSVGYRHILTREQLALFPRGVVNLHTGYLPWNRGAYPNVWPLIDGSPAGVTLHWMDEGIDTGPIIAQERVTVDPWDTAGSLYEKLNDAAFELFKTWWPKVLDGTAPAKSQQHLVGSVHRKADLAVMDRRYQLYPTTDCDFTSEFFHDLRARTFPGQPGLKLCVDDQWVMARIQLEPCEPPK